MCEAFISVFEGIFKIVEIICFPTRTDYVTWNGPDPDLRQGPSKTSAKGANGELLKGKVSLAKGANPGEYYTYNEAVESKGQHHNLFSCSWSSF